MGRFTGWGEWVDAEVPAQVEVELDTGQIWTLEYTDDYVFHEGWISMEGMADIMSSSAVNDAHEKARSIRQNGVRMYGTHYPVHRIKEVRVKKCKWIEAEHEVTIKSWEIEPI